MNKDLNFFFFASVCIYIICSFNVCVYIHILTITNWGGEITIHLNNTLNFFSISLFNIKFIEDRV
jgi:hypothetical protein